MDGISSLEGLAVKPETADKLPPHEPAMEASMIGAIIQQPDLISDCVARFKAGVEIFYDVRSQVVYGALVAMHKAGDPIDLSSLYSHLKRNGGVVGADFISSCLENSIPSNFEHYAERVSQCYMLRKTLATCSEAAAQVYENPDDADSVIGKIESRLQSIREIRQSDVIVGGKTAGKLLLAHLEERYALQGRKSGVVTDLGRFDEITDGLQYGEQTIVGARPSMGKAQPVDAKVLTPFGFKLMGEVKCSDYVIGIDGKPHRVLAIYPQGEKTVNKVTLSDGSVTRCCDDHLWFTQTHIEKRRGCSGSVKSTQEIKHSFHREGGGFNHKLPNYLPVQFERPSNLPIHPYLLGLLLGDGTMKAKSIRFTSADADLHKSFQMLLPITDEAIFDDDITVRVTRKIYNGEKTNLRKSIEALGLNVNSDLKFIPEIYLYSSEWARRELLSGILDTDGCVTGQGKCAEFSTTSRRLSRDVLFLVRSLGGISTEQKPRKTHCYYKGEKQIGAESVRQIIRFFDGWNPFKCIRKIAAWKNCFRRNGRKIIKIEPDGKAQCQCIQVDSLDGIYMTDDFIPTHNTAIATTIIRKACLIDRIPTLVVTLEMSIHSLCRRILSAHHRIPIGLLKNGQYSESEFSKISSFTSFLVSSPIYFIDSISGTDSARICRGIERIVKAHGVKLVIIDYLQKIQARSRHEKRTYEVAEVSSELKACAVKTGVAMLTLAQLNRESEKDKGRMPRLSDLADSSQIERDGDTIALLHRNKEESPEKAALIVAKQRDGEIGTVPLLFEGQYCLFSTPN